MKKVLKYINYFLFIWFNWNFRLACFTISHEIKGEKKYHLDTLELNNLEKLSLQGNINLAEIYQPAGYYILEHLFTKIDELVSEKNLIDFGCGKGRVLVVAAHYNFKMITGIDFAKELAIAAALTVSKASQNLPDTEFKIEWIDAAAYAILPSQNVFFFFNPFKKVVMEKVIDNMLFSKKECSRPMYVIYLNPVLKNLYIDAGFIEKYHHKKMEYVEGVILELP